MGDLAWFQLQALSQQQQIEHQSKQKQQQQHQRQTLDDPENPMHSGSKESSVGGRKGERCNYDFLHFYIQAGYNLGIIPFKSKLEKDTGQYQISEAGLFRKIICGILWSFSLLFRVSLLRLSYLSREGHPVMRYFYFVRPHTSFLLNVLYCRIHASKLLEFRRMMRAMTPHFNYDPGKTKWRSIIINFSQAVWIMLGFTYPFIGLDMITSYEWSPAAIYRNYVSRGKYALFMVDDIQNSNSSCLYQQTNNSCGVCWCDAIFAGISFVLASCYEMQRVFITIAFGVCSITIWVATCDFEILAKTLLLSENENNGNNTTEVGHCGKSTARQICDAFQELRELADSCNGVWQAISFWHVMDSFFWLSMDLDVSLVQATDWFTRVHIFYLLFYSAVAVILSGEADRKIKLFQYMLLTTNKLIWNDDREKEAILLLSQQVEKSCICIGEQGFYRINYHFLSQSMVVVTTFFIILLQYA